MFSFKHLTLDCKDDIIYTNKSLISMKKKTCLRLLLLVLYLAAVVYTATIFDNYHIEGEPTGATYGIWTLVALLGITITCWVFADKAKQMVKKAKIIDFEDLHEDAS
jgi:multidrug transporter EmrE-like cation transporter